MSEKANDLLNKFGSAQFEFMVWNTPDNLVARDKARQEISDYIAELEAERRWIPVSERLPDKNDIVKECNDVATPIDVALRKRIAKLEKDNDEFRQLIHDWIIILTPDDGYVPDSECVRQAMLAIDKEREGNGN